MSGVSFEFSQEAFLLNPPCLSLLIFFSNHFIFLCLVFILEINFWWMIFILKFRMLRTLHTLFSKVLPTSKVSGGQRYRIFQTIRHTLVLEENRKKSPAQPPPMLRSDYKTHLHFPLKLGVGRGSVSYSPKK